MQYTLKRLEYRDDGIFSELRDGKGNVVARTCEHAYDKHPKLYKGTFNCVRGEHQLHSGPPFSTFEVTGVQGHTGILFHVGNYNADSDGCILMGDAVAHSEKGQMITRSRDTFEAFMKSLDGVDSFTLVVE